MKYPAYPKYKPSGVEWLGDVPEHWEVKRTRFMLTMNPSKQEISHLALETEVSFLPMESVGEDGSLKLDATRPIFDVASGYTYFAEGDVSFAKITPCFENGKGAIMCNLQNSFGFGTTELTVVRPGQSLDKKYLYYLTVSGDFRKNGEAWMYGAGGQKRVPDDFVREFRFAFPPLPEQQIIADFLDGETGRIDTLIGKKERLIELLKEKRTALISHVVTKGLNRKVKMKPSGVEWLGDVPKHWAVARTGNIFRIKKEIAGIDGINVLSITQKGIKIKDIESNDGQLSMDYSKYQLVDIGDFAMNHMDLITGFVDIAKFQGVTSPDYRVFRSIDEGEFYSKYYIHIFQLCYFLKIYYDLGQGVSGFGRWRLPRDQFLNFLLPLPPLSEQQIIADFLDQETGKIDALITKVDSAVEKLKEYRIAIISAAVTGKIDVSARFNKRGREVA